MIDIRRVVKVFAGGARALDGVSIAVRENEFFTLLGPSGCGKTTLLRIIAGFEIPDSGAVHLGDEDISHLPPNRRPVNTVFQNYALFPHLTVLQNVAFGLEMRGTAKAQAQQQAQTMLETTMMGGFGNRLPAQLSGGQQQRVALARALACRPRVLLLDEPLSALDLKLRRTMRAELKRAQRETGVTFIFVTHDQEEALAMSDRIAVMSEGQVRQVGEPADIYNAPADRFVAGFIGETNFLSGKVASHGDGLLNIRLDGGGRVNINIAGGDTIGDGDDDGDDDGAITIAIRPERVVLFADDGGARENGITGEVGDIVYLGGATRYDVLLPGGAVLSASEVNDGGGAARFAPGDKVCALLPAESLRALKG